MHMEESPNLRLFPAPAASQGFQSQDRAVLSVLDHRRQKRKRIAGIVHRGLAPQIQPCVGFFKFGICSVSCHFEAIHRREIRIIYAKRNGFLTSFEMTDGATE